LIIDFILPCYNPPEGWIEGIVSNFTKIQKEFGEENTRLIIVNDGSNSLEPQAVYTLRESIPSLMWIDMEVNQGKGAALRTGVRASRGDLSVFTDIDFPYDHASLVKVTKSLMQKDADIVVGYRDEKYYDQTPGARKAVSRLLRWVNRHIFRLPVSDTQCGLKGFNRKGREAFLQTRINRYLFDLEFLLIAAGKKHQCKVLPEEVTLRPGVEFTTLNTWIYLTEIRNVLNLFIRRIFS